MALGNLKLLVQLVILFCDKLFVALCNLLPEDDKVYSGLRAHVDMEDLSDNYPTKGKGRTMLYTTWETSHSLTLYKKLSSSEFPSAEHLGIPLPTASSS